uniref:Uncharacterized protein n=1 Tax=Tanacetum cinerariifolium TaxID=118510 RepID=A0A699KK09_TANCI|nr:hypothetical protein [Tanacetum cinerariifolium]
MKTKEQIEEEDSRALKRKVKSSEDKAAKKHKLDEEVEEQRKHLQIVPNDNDDVYTEATPLDLKESKKCSWSSKGQNLETVRVLWCADYNIHYNTVDLAGREKISTYKVYFGSNAQQLQVVSIVQIVKTVSVKVSVVVYKLRLLVSAAQMRCMRIVRRIYALSFNANCKLIGLILGL